MLIDWFTVGAQALNFLVLVWLMKRFLYKPVLGAIDAREKRIAAELADADTKRADAKQERDEFHAKNESFAQERAALLTQATAEAKAERQRLLDEARRAADALDAKRREALQNDARNLGHALRRRTQDEVFAIARKALGDLAATNLEERIGTVFVDRLRNLADPEKTLLAKALKDDAGPAHVRSAFDLPDEQRANLQRAINETFSADIALRFETAPDLVGGIELSSGGQTMTWSIADYLTSMEKAVGELLKESDHATPKTEAKPTAASQVSKKE
jgi:F-type H+-transporting ATPase subunit b